jgi:hypothetical protein
MRIPLLPLVALVLLGGCFMPASIQNRANQQALDNVRAAAAADWRSRDRVLAQDGWQPVGEAREGRLVERYNESDEVAYSLPATGHYAVLGICTSNCIDMDLVVLDAQRRRIGADLDPDATPVVNFQGNAGNRVTVLVTTPDCRRGRSQPGQEAPGWDCIYYTKLYTRR